MAERVLVLGDDTNAFLAVVRSLGRRGLEVHVAPSNRASAALRSRYIARIHALPSQLGDPVAWGAALRRLIDDHDMSWVVPSSDSSLVRLCHEARGEESHCFAIPNPEAAAAFTDKLATRVLAAAHGVPVAPGQRLDGEAGAARLSSRFGFPMVLKPRRSYVLEQAVEKRSARIVADRAELIAALAALPPDEWLAESFFRGDGVGVSVLAQGGEIVLSYQHRRLAEAWDTGPSTSRVSEAVDPKLLRHVALLARATALTGVAMFEFRVDRRSGDHILLEVNPRFWGSLPLAVDAGADFPALLHELAKNGKVAAPPAYRAGRVKRDLLGEYCRMVREAERGSSVRGTARIAALAVRALSRRGWDSWAPDDPAPFVEERRELFRRLGSAVARRAPTLASALRLRTA